MIDLIFHCFYAFLDCGFHVPILGLLFVFCLFRTTYYLMGVDVND